MYIATYYSLMHLETSCAAPTAASWDVIPPILHLNLGISVDVGHLSNFVDVGVLHPMLPAPVTEADDRAGGLGGQPIARVREKQSATTEQPFDVD
jgi:hypothetical protein